MRQLALQEVSVELVYAYPEIKKNIIFKNAVDANVAKYIPSESFYFKDFAADEEICSPSTETVPVGIIVSGKASISSADGGRNVLLRTIGAGAVFGISTLYSEDETFPTKIYAKQHSKILFIEPSALRALIENDKEAMKGYMTFLNGRIIYLNKKINAFTAGSAERRVALFLADNETDGVYSSDVSLTALSDMLDIGRASLYRAFDRLEESGFIERAEKTIIIKDKRAMLDKYYR